MGSDVVWYRGLAVVVRSVAVKRTVLVVVHVAATEDCVVILLLETTVCTDSANESH